MNDITIAFVILVIPLAIMVLRPLYVDGIRQQKQIEQEEKEYQATLRYIICPCCKQKLRADKLDDATDVTKLSNRQYLRSDSFYVFAPQHKHNCNEAWADVLHNSDWETSKVGNHSDIIEYQKAINHYYPIWILEQF